MPTSIDDYRLAPHRLAAKVALCRHCPIRFGNITTAIESELRKKKFRFGNSHNTTRSLPVPFPRLASLFWPGTQSQSQDHCISVVFLQLSDFTVIARCFFLSVLFPVPLLCAPLIRRRFFNRSPRPCRWASTIRHLKPWRLLSHRQVPQHQICTSIPAMRRD